VHASIIFFLHPPTCIAHTIALLLHDYCAIYAPPQTPRLYAIHHMILVGAISYKGQVMYRGEGGLGPEGIPSCLPPSLPRSTYLPIHLPIYTIYLPTYLPTALLSYDTRASLSVYLASCLLPPPCSLFTRCWRLDFPRVVPPCGIWLGLCVGRVDPAMI